MSLPSLRHRRRRIAFFFDDYFDPAARILEVGGSDGWLGAYLVHAGFLGYRRLAAQPPADFVGELGNWRELGLAAESFDIVIAFEGLPRRESFDDCFALLVPGGRLFLVAPRPGRGRWMRLARRLFGRGAQLSGAVAADSTAVGSFRRRRRRASTAVEWLWLEKPLDSSSEMRIDR